METNIFIDLTTPLASNYIRIDEIICLDSDESFDCSSETRNIKLKPEEARKTNNVSRNEVKSVKAKKKEHIDFGDCPICWEKLGNNQLASTKCGHVFCLKCLQQCLQIEKKCPTCRCNLFGSSAYHPLYLSKT